jgi:hypothetical protein
LRRDFDGLARRHASHCLNVRAKRPPVDELGDHEISIIGPAEIEERQDVRVVECSDDVGFLLEPAHPIGIGSKRGRKNLDCHLPAQAGIVGEINLTHPACTQWGDDCVVLNRVTRAHGL